MRKPYRLTASIAPSRRRIQLPLAARGWEKNTLLSSSELLSQPEESKKNSAAQLVSSSCFVHVAHADGEKSALAPRLFNLLQLQLRISLPSVSAVVSTTSSPCASHLPLTSSSSDLKSKATLHYEQRLAMLRQLCSEVRSIGDVVLTHYQCQHRHIGEDSYKSDLKTAEMKRTSTQMDSDRSGKGENLTSARLIPSLTSTEQKWLQPLQLDVVQQVLTRLTLAELLYQVVLRGEESDSKHSMNDASIHPESLLFFQECARVAAALAALRHPYESDAQPLSCLAHVLQTSISAGAPVSVAALIKAVEGIQGGKSDDEFASSVPSSSGASFSWCSCVPWLLHRYAVTQLLVPGVEDEIDWPTATAWMTAAADRVCATQANELHYHSSTPSGGPSPTAYARSAVIMNASAGLFGPWQRVLNEEGSEEVLGCSGDMKPLASANATDTVSAAEGQLWSWLAGRSGHKWQEGEEKLTDGSLRPYWKAVVRELGSSGAQAAERLKSLFLSLNANAECTVAGRRTYADSSNREQRHALHAPSTAVATLLKDLQFHAIGSYVSLRRITSSLQRHRRLVLLLQLHSLVSGYQPDQDKCSQGEGDGLATFYVKDIEVKTSQEQRQREELRENEINAASMRRHRVLTGELMGVYARYNPKHYNSNNYNIVSYCRQVHQAGAMLWREVVLLDAYTLITLGHVSEHAVDIAVLDKLSVLQQLSWLQQECIQHLRTLEGASQKVKRGERAEPPTSRTTRHDVSAPKSSYRLSPARTKVLLSCLTPRTRATLVEKLREGLRLSAKVLVRWDESERICQLYQSYSGMGASWEVGRALLQCGHYEVAVEVLQSLLEVSPAPGRGAPATASLLSSRAAAMRQLLLEALRGAASALVAKQQQQEKTARTLPPSSISASSTVTLFSLDTPADVLPEGDAGDGVTTEGGTRINEVEGTAPLPAELRVQLHSLYTNSISLPVPLPLCLHAIVQGLTEASSFSPLSSVADPWLSSLRNELLQQQQHDSLTTKTPAMLSSEQLRRTAVLCTYVLRCHLTEQPSGGLLGKTVELWASYTARYLCRQEGEAATTLDATSCRVPTVSMTDRYLREVTVRILYGYPHIPVARLLLARLLQQWDITNPPTRTRRPTTDVSVDLSVAGRKSQKERATLSIQWLLHLLFRYTGGIPLLNSEPQKIYSVCTPDAATSVVSKEDTRWWNADFTERYSQDTLRLMSQIALENLVQFLSEASGGMKVHGLQHVLERVQVALQCRASEGDAQLQPWQCTTCYLWNSRYASECKRCHTLATALLQCRSCGLLTSSAGYRPTCGLSCEVCGTVLVMPQGENSSTAQRGVILVKRQEITAPSVPHSAENAHNVPSSCYADAHAQEQLEEAQSTSLGKRTTVGAATVTGSGRPASLFCASPKVLQVVPLRPWTCTRCRTVNEAQHVFFCHSCGRPSATDAIKASVAAAPQPCGNCGHLPKTTEGCLSPCCERCGSLCERLQHLLVSASSSTTTSRQNVAAVKTSAVPHEDGVTLNDTCGPLQPLTLWWCAECAVSLNPWTQTHCGLCGAGRPAVGTVSVASRKAVSASASSKANASSCVYDAKLEWRDNAAAPFVTVPWSMQPCGACEASNRVGALFCWKCGAAQSWSESVKQTIITGWQRWLTQATDAVTVTSDDDVPSSKESEHQKCGRRSEQDHEGGTDSTTLPVFEDSPNLGVLQLLSPRAECWVCLRDGCLHLNGVFRRQHTNDAVPLPPRSPICCAACQAPRRLVEVFNPFYDRLCWRRERITNKDSNSSPVYRTVEALILPREALQLTETLIAVSETSLSQSTTRSVRLVRRSRATISTTCACCGTPQQEEGGLTPSAPPRAQSIRLRPLFLVTVCPNCGHCSRGRSCGAYESAAGRLSKSPVSSSLLPGEEALALRLLLRSLVQSTQEALKLEVKGRGGNSSGVNRGSREQMELKASCASSSNVEVMQTLDWAWFSRHVFSGVLLFTGRNFSTISTVTSLKDGAVEHGDCKLKQHVEEEEMTSLHDALLPWRACDVASSQQLCSREPRVAVLPDAAGTVHSALVDVREIIEGLCHLVEVRVSKVSATARRRPSSSSPRVPLCLQDAWTRRLLLAALNLIDVVNRSTICDEIGFATLRRLCRLFRPHELDHIDTETKWKYLQEMKLSRSAILHNCVRCECCLRNHSSEQPCSPL